MVVDHRLRQGSPLLGCFLYTLDDLAYILYTPCTSIFNLPFPKPYLLSWYHESRFHLGFPLFRCLACRLSPTTSAWWLPLPRGTYSPPPPLDTIPHATTVAQGSCRQDGSRQHPPRRLRLYCVHCPTGHRAPAGLRRGPSPCRSSQGGHGRRCHRHPSRISMPPCSFTRPANGPHPGFITS
jgi:hypothetical protein